MRMLTRQTCAMTWIAIVSMLLAPIAPAFAGTHTRHEQDSQTAVRAVVMPVTTTDPELQQQREAMVVQLLQLGHAPADAVGMTLQLTQADLDVLLANDRMMQRAAGLSQTTIAVIAGVLIVTVVVLLAVAGESSGSISVGGGM